MLKQLQRPFDFNNILRQLASVRITVVCILLLFILTFWGTVAQVDHGLYMAQNRFFNSFVFFANGVIPFPGAQLVLWVFFVNLIAALITRFRFYYRQWNQWGLLISHAGLILYFISAFITLHMATESNVHLMVGEGTNLSQSYDQWELAYWTEKDVKRQVTAVDADHLSRASIVDFNHADFTLTVNDFYLNSSAYTKAFSVTGVIPLNGSGITLLQQKAMDKERSKNVAGVSLTMKTSTGHQYPILLYGLEANPTVVPINGVKFNFILRHKRIPLPFTIVLKKFEAQFYPGTNMAKSYESLVEIIKDGVSRNVRIYMNNPFRYKDYTLYQSSYDVDSRGRQYSTLAVVKNKGQVLPYIACFAVFFGLAYHFCVVALRRKWRE